MFASAETLLAPRCRPEDFVQAMSRTVNGVSIVTTDGPSGRYGMTVSSMTSVSAEPSMLLVCVNSGAVPHDPICANARFTINVLAASQQRLANRFAGMTDDAYAFDRESWDLHASMPRLRHAAAWFECRLASSTRVGSHSIVVGEVTDARGSNATPLLYTGRNYGRPVTLN